MATKKVNVQFVLEVDGNNELKKVTAETKKFRNEVTHAGIEAAKYDKYLKGASQTGKNATSNFAKQAQGMGGLVHVYATVAANVFALSAAYTVLKNNADLQIMQQSANDLAVSTGISYASVAKSMKELTGGAISFTGAMRQANLALSGGATIAQVEEITTIANKAANTLGLSVPNAVGRMIQAVTKGEPELVDELGIILRVTKATEEYADKINKTANTLTTFEKQQAIINQLIKQGNEKFKDVNPQTNPYEKLSSSVVDLSTNLVSMVSGPLSSVVNLISNSTGLMAGGIGLLVTSIGKKALPILAEMGASWEQNATQQANKAAEATKDFEKATDDLAAKRAARQEVTTQKKFGKDLKDIIEKDLLPKVDKRSKLYKGLKSSISDAIAKGTKAADMGEEIVHNLKKSGVKQEIKKLLAIKPGDMGVSKMAKNLINSRATELDLLMNRIRLVQKTNIAKEQEERARSLEEDVRKYAQNMKAKASFSTGMSNILNANGPIASFKASIAGITDLTNKYSPLIARASGYNKQLVRSKLLMRQLAIGAVGFGKTLAGMGSKLISWGTGLLFGVEIIKQGLSYLGLYDRELTKQAKSLESINKTLLQTKHNYKNIGEELKTQPTTIEETAAKWKKMANVADQYSNSISKTLKQLEGLKNASWLQNLDFFGLGGAASTAKNQGYENIITGIKELERLTGKKYQLDLTVKSPSSEQADILAKINRAKEMLKKVEITTANGKGERKVRDNTIAKMKKTIQYLNSELEKLGPIKTKQISLNADTNQTDFNELANAGTLKAQQKIAKYNSNFTIELRKMNSAANDAITSTQSLDGILTKLAGKSESRRILNVDTLIQIRDEIQKSSSAMKEFVDIGLTGKGAIDAAADIKNAFMSIPKGIRDAFIKANPNASVEELQKATEKAYKSMDKNIEKVRGAKAVLGRLGAEKQMIKTNIDNGNIEQELALYENTKSTLEAQVEAKKASMAITKVLAEGLLGKEALKNSAILEQQQAELDALNQKYLLLNSMTPIYKIQLGKLEKISAKHKADRDIFKDKQSLFSKEISMYAKRGKFADKLVDSLAASRNMSAMQHQNNLDMLSDAEAKLILEKEYTKSLGEKVDLDLFAKNLRDIQTKKELEILSYKQEQLKVEKQLFDANNKKRGIDTKSGLANSFAGIQTAEFWKATGKQLGMIADDMANRIGNGVKIVADTYVSAMDTISTTYVSALLSHNWDGKEEGRSMAVAIREALKDSLRQTIGKAISDNMTQAMIKLGQALFNSESLKQTSTDMLISSNSTLIAAINANTVALGGSSYAPNLSFLGSGFGGIGSASKTGSVGNYGPLFGPGDSLAIPYATGGVVHRPTNALIGEGKNSEAIVPLPDNRSIPVKLEGSAQKAGDINVNQSFDFSGADASTEAKLRQYAAQIKADTIAAITDSINRGGNMAKVVGRR